MKLLNKLVCHFKGHISLQRDQEYTRIYKEIKGYGAFGRGVYYEYSGRLHHCSRCGELHVVCGVLMWELEDLITDTLKDLPKIGWTDSEGYSFVNRLYKKSNK